MVSYSQTMHYWMISLKEDPTSNPCRGGIITRGSAFEGEPTIDTEDWEGHDGSKGIKLASDRTKASAEPQWEQAVMFGEGVEDFFYLLLASTSKKTESAPIRYTYDDRTEITLESGETGYAYTWKFFQDLVNPVPLPTATIINGYSAVENDAITYDNAKMSELEISIDDGGINLTNTFGSNAPILNQANPVRPVMPELSRLGVNGIEVYIADFGTDLKDLTAQELETYHYGCIVSSSNTFNTNLEDSICIGGVFGKNDKDEGAFENDGSMELRWSPDASKLIDKWYTGEADGTKITEQLCFQEILIRGTSRKLGTANNEDVYETFEMYLPKVQIDKAWSDLSGDETKTINIEYSLVNNGTTSPVYVEIVSKLESLHWGTPQATESVQDS